MFNSSASDSEFTKGFSIFIFQYLKYNNDTDVIKDRVITLANAVDAVSIQFWKQRFQYRHSLSMIEWRGGGSEEGASFFFFSSYHTSESMVVKNHKKKGFPVDWESGFPFSYGTGLLFLF